MHDSTLSQFGPYTLLYSLGAGGMGQVFLARQRGEHGIQRLVALKRILVHLTKSRRLVDLFLDEVRIAAQLTHGNIVQVLDHGAIDGQYYMAMEYVHGESLAEALTRIAERGQRLPLDLALYIATCTCAGLEHAHHKEGLDGRALGIVHRDVSPHNILLSFQGEVKIADFGVARAAEQTHQTLGGELKGKLAYMSPEQGFGRDLDQRSDLYSLGVVIYEMLAGQSPLLRANPMATLEAVRTAQIAPLAEVRPDLPPEVTELVQRTLSPQVDDRPDSARTLYEELQRTMRLHALVASGFDLADFLKDLFPESRSSQRDSSDARTEPGRRADEGVEAERRTLFYLQQRHADLAAAQPSASWRGSSRWGKWVTVAGLVGLVLGVTLIVGAAVVLLRRAGSGSGARTMDAAAARRPDRAAERTSVEGAPASAPTRTLTLAVRSIPSGAWVAIDGRRLAGVTPLTVSVAAEARVCTVGLRGYKVWRTTLRGDERQTLEARLEALPTSLSVTSSHRCELQVNGKALGPTPLTDRPVPAGALELRCQEASGARAQRRVRAAPGERLRVDLGFGVLAVNVEPWAEVSVDGVRRRQTPLNLLLPEGPHRVQLRNSERKLQREVTITISRATPARISSW
jgi:eukaryotic-like serine/threonine-protein kinase